MSSQGLSDGEGMLWYGMVWYGTVGLCLMVKARIKHLRVDKLNSHTTTTRNPRAAH